MGIHTEKRSQREKYSFYASTPFSLHWSVVVCHCRKLRKRKRLLLYLPNSLTPSKPLSVTALLLVPVFVFEILVPGSSPHLPPEWWQISAVCSSPRAVIYCTAGMTNEQSSSPLPMVSARHGKQVCGHPVGVRGNECVWCPHTCGIYVHGPAGGLLRKLSTVTNAINLNTRVDLAQKNKQTSKPNQLFSLRPFPTLTSSPFIIITWRGAELQLL